jgi:hypothetical protein
MANPSWNVSGEYFETCSCDFVCPCPTSGMMAPPSKGSCTFILAFRIDDGQFDGTALNGLHFVVAARTPEAMAKGNWSVGVITDERATPEQQQALVAVASGQAGGPMAAVAPLIGTFLGVEARPIHFKKDDGMRWSLEVPGMIDQAAEGVAGGNPGEPIALDNVGHPVNTRLALAHATRSHLHAFGLDWDDDSGRNNGHFAPFSWQA